MSNYDNIFRGEFSKAAMEQAATAKRMKTASFLPYRSDLRGKNVFSFAYTPNDHCETAFSISKQSDGWQLGIHVTDVCEYVVDGSPLDTEARKRCATLDNGQHRSEMLPETIVSDLCDLTSPGDKLALSILLDINSKGELISIDAEESIISQSKKCIYEEIQLFSETSDTSALMILRNKYSNMREPLFAMYALAAVLLQKRLTEGAPEWFYYTREYKTDKEGNIESYSLTPEIDIHAVAREIGFFVSDCIGKKMTKEGIPCVYIGQDTIEDKALDYLAALLGHKCNEKDPLKRTVHIIEEAKGSSYFNYICLCLNEGLPCAHFSDKPVNNVLYGKDHVVSIFRPATSYSDLLALRTIKTYVSAGGAHNLNLNKLRRTVAEFVKEANHAHKYAFDARRAFATAKAQEHVAAHPEERFAGFPAEILDNGEAIVFLLCGCRAAVSPEDAKKAGLVIGKEYEFALKEYVKGEHPIVKPL